MNYSMILTQLRVKSTPTQYPHKLKNIMQLDAFIERVLGAEWRVIKFQYLLKDE